MNAGFLYVATYDYKFYRAALYSIESLKDYYPDAKVCLFTHDEWVNNRTKSLCDYIVTESVPRHDRAKLWALDKTPFDVTTYMDSDTEVVHEDIKNIFDEITDKDMAFGPIFPYAVKTTDFPAGKFTLHCGLFLYKNNKNTRSLMWDWWLSFLRFNDQKEWPFDENFYPFEIAKWDTFGLWWLLNKTYYKDIITYRVMPVRFNFIHTYRYEELDGDEIVVWHEPLPGAM